MKRLRKWLAKWLLGFDPEIFKAETELMIEITAAQVVSITKIIADMQPYSQEWPEAASKAILSLDERLAHLTEIVSLHKEALRQILDIEEKTALPKKTNKNHLN